MDIVTLALNLYSQGVDPGLNLSNLNEVSRTVTKCTDNPIHQRHPYSGELVFTAFSGSHQDAISKGMKEWSEDPSKAWDVPYIPIDPKDIGRDYSTIIRVNSQSGKGGVAYLLKEQAGLELPRQMQPEFSQVVQKIAEETGKEIPSDQIEATFRAEYIDCNEPFELLTHEEQQVGDLLACHAVVKYEGRERPIAGKGNGPIAAFVAALSQLADIEMLGFHEHSLGRGSTAEAAAYVLGQSNGKAMWGVGVDESATTASLKAVVSALNRLEQSSRSC